MVVTQALQQLRNGNADRGSFFGAQVPGPTTPTRNGILYWSAAQPIADLRKTSVPSLGFLVEII